MYSEEEGEPTEGELKTEGQPRRFLGINKVTLLGTVGNTPKIINFQNGDKIASFSVATNTPYKDNTTGEWKHITEWHDVVVSSNALTVDYIGKHVVKGTRVYLEGSIKTRTFTDARGEEQRKKIISLSTRKSDFQIVKRAADHNAEGSTEEKTDLDSF